MTTLILSAEHLHDGNAMAAAGTALVIAGGRIAEVATVDEATRRHPGTMLAPEKCMPTCRSTRIDPIRCARCSAATISSAPG